MFVLILTHLCVYIGVHLLINVCEIGHRLFCTGPRAERYRVDPKSNIYNTDLEDPQYNIDPSGNK